VILRYGIQIPADTLLVLFSIPNCPEWHWGPPSPLTKWSRNSFPWEKRSGLNFDHWPP